MTISRRSLCAMTVALAAVPRLAFAKSYHTGLSIPQIVRRSRGNDDWLAAAANLAAWQSEIAIGEGVVLQQISNPARWRDAYEADTGLAVDALAAFAVDAGLVVDNKSKQTLDHWNNLLNQSGPIWIGVANQTFKAGQVWVIAGINGDGSDDRTDMSVINLETGEAETLTVKKFTDRYQAAAKADGITGKIKPYVLRLA